MIDVTPVVTALQALIVATWPETIHAGNGALEAEHADQIPWADLTLPAAVILIEDVPRYEGSPLDADWGLATVELYYVTTARGGSDGHRVKLKALGAALKPDPLAAAGAGQVVRVLRQSWSARLPVNQTLRDANRSQRAGVLVFEVLVTDGG